MICDISSTTKSDLLHENFDTKLTSRSRTGEDEDDTYARVELAATSQLRSKPRSIVVENERAVYCNILEFQRRVSHEDDEVEVDNEYEYCEGHFFFDSMS
jgi:hypothetical protein